MNSLVFTSEQPDPIANMLGTRFNRFETAVGIEGLAREDHPEKIEVLAVASTDEGKGQFRSFIELLKQHYKIICIWHDMNPILTEALKRYGFEHEVTVDEFGELLTGWRWERKSQ